MLSVKGSSYVVEIREGTFSLDETLTLYRQDAYGARTSVGRGTVVRRDPVTFSGSGLVARVYVT